LSELLVRSKPGDNPLKFASARADFEQEGLPATRAIDGIVERSRARGIVRGHGDEPLVFELVARGDDVRAGDIVISSGLGGVYPKGLRIGTIGEVADPEEELVQTASLAPSVDFGRLEQVFVLLRRAPTMDLLYGVEGDQQKAQSPTESPTEFPAEPPTEPPTESPTEPPTEAEPEE
jgi:cell shape-determining protein MreC